MKFSYRSNPVLALLNGEKTDITFDSNINNPMFATKGVPWVIAKNKTELQNNVIVVSDPFAEAAMSCQKKMLDAELYKDIGDFISGVILYKDFGIIYKANRTMVDGIGAWAFNVIEFQYGTFLKTFVWEGVCNYTHKDDSNQTPEIASKSVFAFVKTVLMFKKFAQVETKYLPAGQKVKGVDCKYINETKSNITYLCSTWFTTLVKSDAFKVRGHFRLQPKKKDGEWTKELIWINEFKKDGYTAPARMIEAVP